VQDLGAPGGRPAGPVSAAQQGYGEQAGSVRDESADLGQRLDCRARIALVQWERVQ
jgi:hypothetical protein